jgi:hypothetical protein
MRSTSQLLFNYDTKNRKMGVDGDIHFALQHGGLHRKVNVLSPPVDFGPHCTWPGRFGSTVILTRPARTKDGGSSLGEAILSPSNKAATVTSDF